MSSKSKIFHSDPSKDKMVCKETYDLLVSLRKLGLEFNIPLREILAPHSLDGIMLDTFYRAFIREEDD